MTKKQKEIVANLHTADVFLRNAMRLAGDMVVRGNVGMRCVTNDIREAEGYLDDALSHAETCSKNNSRKLLTTKKACAKVCA